MTDLLTSAGVDVPDRGPKGVAYPATYQAARLMGMVEALAYQFDDDYPARCRMVATYAEKIGAHSVARAVRWQMMPRALDRYGYTHIHATMERAAERYLARVEARRSEAWGR